MKTTGIVLIILGILSTIGAFTFAAHGQKPSFAGLAFIVLGAFLISRANKKKEKEDKKKQWEQGNPKE